MGQKTLAPALARHALEIVAECGTKAAACRKHNIAPSTLDARLRAAKRMGITLEDGPEAPPEAQLEQMDEVVRKLRAELTKAQSDEVTRAAVRKYIFDLKDEKAAPPKWMVKPGRGENTGVPTLFLSDLHWGEVVTPSAISHSNEFNLDIAHVRMRRTVETCIDLLKCKLAGAEYPGIVLALGGDMISGDIQEELSRTNAAPTLPTILDLLGVLMWVIDTLADEFGNVYLPCVTGNHGRNTRKPIAKERNETNFDWLIYRFLHLHFKDDKRIQFNIPDGPDCHYRIFSHRYCLTHGDQFRGGNGIAGPLMTIVRGRHKKISRDAGIGEDWDTLIMGHWHQLIMLQSLIVNGSMKGYDEYAYQNNFEFQPPNQACWITHPDHGITFQMPIYCDEGKPRAETSWVSWAQ